MLSAEKLYASNVSGSGTYCLETTTRVFKVEVDDKELIPHLMNFYLGSRSKQAEILVTVTRRLPMCLKCKQIGHHRASCIHDADDKSWCRHCQANVGHSTNECDKQSRLAKNASRSSQPKQLNTQNQQNAQNQLNVQNQQNAQGQQNGQNQQNQPGQQDDDSSESERDDLKDSDFEFDADDVERWEQEKKTLLQNDNEEGEAQPGTSVADANEGFRLVEKKNGKRKQKSSKTKAQAVQSKRKKIKTTAKSSF